MRRLCIISLLLFTAAGVQIARAEEQDTGRRESAAPPPGGRYPGARIPGGMPDRLPDGEFTPRFRGRRVTLDINARLVEQNQTVVWNESHRKETLLGSPVGLKLVGTNVVVVVQLTPYIRHSRGVLVAQGQIWMDIPGQGIRYHTTLQTIPVEFGESVYFFPLGSVNENDDARMEIMITIQPNEEN